MESRIQLGQIEAVVTLKDIKNVHLSVRPPDGTVTVSAPRRMSLESIRLFLITKLDWIKAQQKALAAQPRESDLEHIDRESHYVWGQRCLLNVIEHHGAPKVELSHTKLKLCIRPDTPTVKRREILDEWYREELKRAVPDLLAKWQPILGVEAAGFYVQRMRTQWGSCNPRARTIRLNTDLAKKPREHLEHVIVHELIHLLEPSHNARFVALMDRYVPLWREQRKALNSLPVRHEDWGGDDSKES